MTRNNENKYQDFDRHFHEAFKDAEVRPPADLFERIHQHLPAQKRTLNLVYLVAASIVVLLTIGIIIKTQIYPVSRQFPINTVKQSSPVYPIYPTNSDLVAKKSKIQSLPSGNSVKVSESKNSKVDIDIKGQVTDNKLVAARKKQNGSLHSENKYPKYAKGPEENSTENDKTRAHNEELKKQRIAINSSSQAPGNQQDAVADASLSNTIQPGSSPEQANQDKSISSNVAVSSVTISTNSSGSHNEIAKEIVELSNKSNQTALPIAGSARKKKNLFNNLLGSFKKKLTNISNDFVTENEDKTTIQIGFIAISKYK